MYSHLDPNKLDDIIQRAMDIIQDHKTTMLNLQAALDIGSDGYPHVIVSQVEFATGWQDLPPQTFKGEGKIKMLERDADKLVIYYAIKSGSYFLKHSVDVPFSLHVCYGRLTCTVNGGEVKIGATGSAKANQLHQLCFPVDTGMIITFFLS